MSKEKITFGQKNSHHRKINNLGEYFGIFSRNLMLIAAFTTLAAVLGYFVASNITPAYRSTLSLMVESDDTKNMAMMPGIVFSKSDPLMQAQLELLRSRGIAEAVVERLDLKTHPDFFPPQKSAVQAWIEEMVGLSDAKQVNRIEKQASLEEVPYYILSFRKRLSVANEKGSTTINITFESSDRFLAAKIANEIVEVYRDKLRNQRKEHQENAVGWLSSRLEEVRKQLVSSEAQLKAYQDQSNLVDSNDEKKIRSDKLSGMTAQIIKARAKRADAEAVYNQMHKVEKQSGRKVAVSIVDDARLKDLIAKEESLKFDIQRQSARYGDKHPKMIALQQQYAEARKLVKKEVDRVYQRVIKERDLARANESEANRLYNEILSEFSSLKKEQFQLSKLELEVSTNRELYNMLLTRLKEADLNRVTTLATIRILDKATVPASPYKPNKLRILMIALLLGLAISISFAVYREVSDPTFKTGEELIDRLDLPLLGVIPVISRRAARKFAMEKFVANRPKSTIAEAFNNVRTNIIMGKASTPPKTLLVTSAVASEGKTTISGNLAISLAALGPTLILEADARKPRFRKLVEETPEGGLLEYLSGRAGLKSSVVRDPDVENLFVMPVNSIPAKPLEMFSSNRFKNALEQIKPHFKYIIIDSPPVLPVSDTVVISPLVDGVVMVVGAEQTHKKAVFGAVDRLHRVGANVMGTVLSRANIKTMSSYGDHYYYGYDKYESAPKPV